MGQWAIFAHYWGPGPFHALQFTAHYMLALNEPFYEEENSLLYINFAMMPQNRFWAP